MVTSEEIERLLAVALPDAEIKAVDLTGGGDHWQLTVIAKQFSGLSLVSQHQLVYKALGDKMKRDIHALALTTKPL